MARRKKGVNTTNTKRKYQQALMSYNNCMDKTIKQIRRTAAYKKLVPFGTYMNKSQKYHYGRRSVMKKGSLCQSLSDPIKYHRKIKRNFDKNRNSSKRKRDSRLGDCRPYQRRPPCSNTHKHVGVTTTSNKCCYKRKMSKKTLAKRRRNTSIKKRIKRNYNKNVSNQGKRRPSRSRERS